MKLSRLTIDQFGGDDSPDITKNDVAGDDLVIKGGNRSGKTLTFNAVLYGLYGPRATYGVSPGHRCTVQLHFDKKHVLERGGGGREYHDGEKVVEKDAVEDKIREHIGPEELITLQFLHSEAAELPLAKLSPEDRLSVIRRVVDNALQDEIAGLKDQKEDLEQELERVRRTELQPRQEDLDDIDVGRYERRAEKIEQVAHLIDSGRIETIKQRLLDDDALRDKLNSVGNRKRTVEQELRKKRRRLREARRYTQEVNSLIIDAIQELTCPVCDQIVVEKTAKKRLQQGRCPQCGRERTLDELKNRLEAKVDHADDEIAALKSEIESLENEREELSNEMETLRRSVPDLSDMNNLTQHTLEKHDYDIAAVAEETEAELAQHRSHIEELHEREAALETDIEEVKTEIGEIEAALEATIDQIEDFAQESFDEVVRTFREAWSQNYEDLAPDLAVELNIERDGSVILPGNDGPRPYDELSTGERRLLNISFAYTLAKQANGTSDGGHNWECLVLDEPFANIDEDIQENAVDFLQDSDLQFVITTSNEDLVDRFDSRQVEALDRIHVQYTFDEIEELAADD